MCDLKRHVNIHLGERHFNCMVTGCSKDYGSKRCLDQHMALVHHSKGSFKCTNCPMTFGSKHYLTQHTANSHLHRPFKCKEIGCSKDFGTKRYLNRHMAVVHFAKKTYKCTASNCERIFGGKSELEIHQRSAGHGKEKLMCHFANCTAAFASTSKLSRHKKTVHLKEKPFKCLEQQHSTTSTWSFLSETPVIFFGHSQLMNYDGPCSYNFGSEA